jgi:hypothetical protein
MFSSETLIKMTNGTSISISAVKVGDYIMNKLNKPVKVTKVRKINEDSVCVHFDNDTNPFYCNVSVLFMSRIINEDGSNNIQYLNIVDINTHSYKLKSSCKLLSYESDVGITSYNATLVLKDLYSLYTNDDTNTYFVNNVITCCEN